MGENFEKNSTSRLGENCKRTFFQNRVAENLIAGITGIFIWITGNKVICNELWEILTRTTFFFPVNVANSESCKKQNIYKRSILFITVFKEKQGYNRKVAQGVLLALVTITLPWLWNMAHIPNPSAWKTKARRQIRVKDYPEFQGNLGYIVGPCFNLTTLTPKNSQKGGISTFMKYANISIMFKTLAMHCDKTIFTF